MTLGHCVLAAVDIAETGPCHHVYLDSEGDRGHALRVHTWHQAAPWVNLGTSRTLQRQSYGSGVIAVAGAPVDGPAVHRGKTSVSVMR